MINFLEGLLPFLLRGSGVRLGGTSKFLRPYFPKLMYLSLSHTMSRKLAVTCNIYCLHFGLNMEKTWINGITMHK